MKYYKPQYFKPIGVVAFALLALISYQNFTSNDILAYKTQTFSASGLIVKSGEKHYILGSDVSQKFDSYFYVDLKGTATLVVEGQTIWKVAQNCLVSGCDVTSGTLAFNSAGNLIFYFNGGKYYAFNSTSPSLNSPTLTVSNREPYLQIADSTGILWMARRHIARFYLTLNQKIKIPAAQGLPAQQLLLTAAGLKLTTSDNSAPVTLLNVPAGTSANKTVLSENGMILIYNSSNALIASFGSKYGNSQTGGKDLKSSFWKFSNRSPIISEYSDGLIIWANTPNTLKCASITVGSVNCLHSDMPLYSQGSRGLLDYVNLMLGTKLTWDTGWCVPTSAAMIGKTMSIEKQKFYDFQRNIKPSKLFNFNDSNNINEIIYNWMIEAKTNIIQGGTYMSDLLAAWGRVFPFYTNSTDRTPLNEDKIPKLMPLGIIDTCVHAYAINGREGKYLKLFDPWGSIYDVETDSSYQSISFVKNSSTLIGVYGAELLAGCNGVSTSRALYLLQNYVPVGY